MSLKARLDADIKTAMLAGDKTTVEVLKSLKSAILYEEVALKVRDPGLSEDQIVTVLTREAKKRSETADLYNKAGETERSKVELAEKEVIDKYLPKQLDDAALSKAVDEAIQAAGANAQMGQVIGIARAKVGALADGGRIAAMVKQKLGM